MKYLALVAVAALSVSAYSQTSASANSTLNSAAQASAGQNSAAASATQASRVSAELTKKIDTKNAHVGDQVFARTTSASVLSDGTRLPKGTKLLGKVTDVQARSGAEKTSRLAFDLDHAVLRNGREIPVHTTLSSLSAPAASLAGSSADELSAGPVRGSAAGSGQASSGGGGLLGGGGLGQATGGLGSVAGGVTRGVGSAANGIQSTAGDVTSTAGAAANGAVQAGSSTTADLSGTVNSATSLASGPLPVANLPGVNFLSSANQSTTAVLTGSNRNIDLESGAQLTLNLSASNQ